MCDIQLSPHSLISIQCFTYGIRIMRKNFEIRWNKKVNSLSLLVVIFSLHFIHLVNFPLAKMRTRCIIIYPKFPFIKNKDKMYHNLSKSGVMVQYFVKLLFLQIKKKFQKKMWILVANAIFEIARRMVIHLHTSHFPFEKSLNLAVLNIGREK